MNNKPDGGPFHPQPVDFDTRSGQMLHDGASLRDWFAAMATEADIEQHMDGMNGFWGTVNEETGQRKWMLPREQARYAFADAMIEARSK